MWNAVRRSAGRAMSIDAIPIWALFAATVLIVMTSIEIGYRAGDAVHRRSDNEKESPVSAMAGAVLGLAAFMLAFTFGIVAERHDSKKSLVRDDASAIRTVWHRADFLPEADRAEAVAMLRRYVDLRLGVAQADHLDPEGLKTTLAQTRQLQDRLWAMAVDNARKDMNSDVAALYIDALNTMTTVHFTRVAIAIQARVPVEIWLMLYSITILGMACVGYQTGIAGSKRSMAGPIVALSFAMVFALIASLDRPDSGILRVTQQPMLDLRSEMNEGAAR
jgi:hypothetical protein